MVDNIKLDGRKERCRKEFIILMINFDMNLKNGIIVLGVIGGFIRKSKVELNLLELHK